MTEERKRKSRRERRRANNSGYTRAEWIVLFISFAILLALVSVVTYEYYVTGTRPAAVEVEPDFEKVEERDGQFYLPIQVTNSGDEAVTDLRVEFLLGEGEQQRRVGEALLPTLAGGDDETVVIILDEDPGESSLQTLITYVEP